MGCTAGLLALWQEPLAEPGQRGGGGGGVRRAGGGSADWRSEGGDSEGAAFPSPAWSL